MANSKKKISNDPLSTSFIRNNLYAKIELLVQYKKGNYITYNELKFVLENKNIKISNSVLHKILKNLGGEKKRQFLYGIRKRV